MSGRFALIFLCTILLKQATSAAINEENKTDFNTFHNFIKEKFPKVYTLLVENNIPILKKTLADMEALHDKHPEVDSKTTDITNYIKEAEKPLNIVKQHSLLLKWEGLFQRKVYDQNANTFVFITVMDRNGFEDNLTADDSKYIIDFYKEFDTKLNKLWQTLTELQKTENPEFTAWYRKYEKLSNNVKNHKFKMWGDLFAILENKKNEL